MPPWLGPALTLAALAAMAGVLLPRWQALAAGVICVLAMWLVLHPAAARDLAVLGALSDLCHQAAADIQALGGLNPLH
jgi:hypothetical protein